MKTLLGVVFIFLAVTFFIWPLLFVRSFLRAQEKIRNGENYEKEETMAFWSLLFITATPFVGILLIIF